MWLTKDIFGTGWVGFPATRPFEALPIWAYTPTPTLKVINYKNKV